MEKIEKAIQLYNAKKYKESFSSFKAMAETPEISYYLGMHYFLGLGVKQSDDKALSYFRKAWEGLYPEGIYMVGRMYELGRGVELNLKQAFKLYHAANQSLNAKLRLASMYELGIATDKDMAKAVRFYNECQKEGSGYAMYKIGQFYLLGQGLKKNLKNAYAWLQKSLGKNHILAVNYFRLIGKKPTTDNRSTEDILNQAKAAFNRSDKEYALSFLELAIHEGSLEGLMMLVDAYLDGRVVEKSEALAYDLLLKHQDLNKPSIDYRIGVFYELGIGVLSSYYKAGLFYEKAANEGLDIAKKALSELRGY